MTTRVGRGSVTVGLDRSSCAFQASPLASQIGAIGEAYAIPKSVPQRRRSLAGMKKCTARMPANAVATDAQAELHAIGPSFSLPSAHLEHRLRRLTLEEGLDQREKKIRLRDDCRM